METVAVPGNRSGTIEKDNGNEWQPNGCGPGSPSTGFVSFSCHTERESEGDATGSGRYSVETTTGFSRKRYSVEAVGWPSFRNNGTKRRK